MEYRNIIYYLIFFPAIIFIVGFPFYFGIGKSNFLMISYLFYIIVISFLLKFIQKKYWSWILEKRRNKVAQLIRKKYNQTPIIVNKQYLALNISNENLLLKFNFSNYPPHHFSAPKNKLEIYIEKNANNGNNGKLKVVQINSRDWLYDKNKFKDFFINRSIESLVKNSQKEINYLIDKSKLI